MKGYAPPPCQCGSALHLVECEGRFRVICPACEVGPLAATPEERAASVPCGSELPKRVPPVRYAVRWRGTAEYPVASDGWLAREWGEHAQTKRLVRKWVYFDSKIWDGESFPSVDMALRAFDESGQGGFQYFEAVPVPPRVFARKKERPAW